MILVSLVKDKFSSGVSSSSGKHIIQQTNKMIHITTTIGKEMSLC